MLDLLEKRSLAGQLIAVGNGASEILNQMTEHVPCTTRTIAIVTDQTSLAISRAHKKVLIGQKTCEGFGCGASPSLGMRAALEDAESIISILGCSKVNIVIACLGGGTGTGAGPLLAGWSTILGVHTTVAVVTMPFGFEGTSRYDTALQGLMDFMKRIELVQVFHNQSLFDQDQSLPIMEARSRADEIVMNYCLSLCRELDNPEGTS